MNRSVRRWMVGAFLLGAMAWVGAPSAQAQYYPQDRRDTQDRRDAQDRWDPQDRRDTYESRQGSRWGYRDYQREIRFLEEQVRRDKEELRLDSRRFGKNSFQARAARERLKRDERELKQLKKDMKRDRKLMQRRDDRGPYRY